MPWRIGGRVFLVLTLAVCFGGTEIRHWRTDRQPRIASRRISLSHLNPVSSSAVRGLIVDIHNLFRSRVQPAAADMLRMTWSEAAASDARRWAGECRVLQHDNTTGRWTHRFGSCGQNIFISTHMVPWLFAIRTWWLEKDLFKYGNHSNDLDEVGHYTQLVWAATHKVGCGIEKCDMDKLDSKGRKTGKRRKYFLYVCNYCPIGNFADRLHRPYTSGPPCSECPGHCWVDKESYKDVPANNATVKVFLKSKPRNLLTEAQRRRHLQRLGRRRSRGLQRKRRRRRTGRKKEKGNGKNKPTIKAVPKKTNAPSEKEQHGIKLKLCSNACQVADFWINCNKLAQEWGEWLCSRESNWEKGQEGYNNCRATCTCKGKIKN